MPTITRHDTLYNVDSKGKVRTWRMETDGEGRHRTVSGLETGQQVASGWVVCEAKNEGRSNSTTPAMQALSEVKSDYTKKLEQKYYPTKKEAMEAGSGMKFLQPMLAYKWTDYEKGFHESQMFWAQPKLDGIRATLSSDGLMSRAGKPLPGCPHIVEAMAEFFHQFPGVVLDGELYNHDLKADFNKITSLVKKAKPNAQELAESERLIQFHYYDLPSHAGKFSERCRFLEDNVDHHWCIRRVETRHVNRSQLDECYGEWLEAGYEGQMVRLDMPYENKRSKSLLKRKEFLDEEFPVSEVREGLGSWAGCAKRVEIILPGDKRDKFGKRPEAGVRGTMEFLKGVYDRSQAGEPPTQVTVRFQNYTPDGMPRFGVVTAFYWGERDL